MAIDYYSNIYVTDPGAGCIYKFDRYLTFITRFGCGTSTADDLAEPRGITIYRRFGQVFVVEKAGASYFWVGTDIQQLSCSVDRGVETPTIEARFLLTEYSHVTVSLETPSGDVVEILAQDQYMPPGYLAKRYSVSPQSLRCPLAKCKYRLTIRARATYSSRPYHEVVRSTPIR